MEANLLRYLIQHEGKPVSRKTMLEEVWGLHEDTDTRAIDNFIVRLRRYIEDDPTKPRHLLTVRGVGYRFRGGAGGRSDAARLCRRLSGLALSGAGSPLAAPAETSHFVLLGDRTGEAQPGSTNASGGRAGRGAAGFRGVGGRHHSGAATMPRRRPNGGRCAHCSNPTARFRCIWRRAITISGRAASERLFRQYAGHPPHYSFDSGGAHFTVLDNSRSDAWPAGELALAGSRSARACGGAGEVRGFAPALVAARCGAGEHERAAARDGEALRRLLRGRGARSPVDSRGTGWRPVLRAAQRGRAPAAERQVRGRLVFRLDGSGNKGREVSFQVHRWMAP